MDNDQDALTHLKERLDAATADRDAETQNEMGSIKRRAAAAGRLGSGSTVKELNKQAVEDIRIRGEKFYRALLETWMSFRPTADAIPRAKEMLTSTLRQAADAHEMRLRAGLPALGLTSFPESVWQHLRAECEQPQRDLSLRLVEWSRLLQQPPTSNNTSQTTNVTLTGDNNMVVAGLMHSTANVQLDAASTSRLLAALAEARSAIETTDSLSLQDRSETLELIADATNEIERPQPNKRKLAGSLQGIATAIQTVGVLGDAYSTLKSAMALIGIPLP